MYYDLDRGVLHVHIFPDHIEVAYDDGAKLSHLDDPEWHDALVHIRRRVDDILDGSPAGRDVLLRRLRDDFVDALANCRALLLFAPDAANDIAKQLCDALAEDGR